MPSLEEIIAIIQGLPLKDALSYLVAAKIFDYAGQGVIKVKQIIRDKYNEGKYAFVPNKEEAVKLKNFEEDPNYEQVKMFVPCYRYIDIIRTGLLIDFYLKRNNADDQERVKLIKAGVLNRPNGNKLLKIANLPCTPFFRVIMGYLYEKKTKGYSSKQLEEIFDEVITKWENASLFVKNEYSKQKIISFCKEQIKQKNSPIFLLAMLKATKKLDDAMNKLKAPDYFAKNSYYVKTVLSEEGKCPRVEVMLILEGSPLLP